MGSEGGVPRHSIAVSRIESPDGGIIRFEARRGAGEVTRRAVASLATGIVGGVLASLVFGGWLVFAAVAAVGMHAMRSIVCSESVLICRGIGVSEWRVSAIERVSERKVWLVVADTSRHLAI